MRTAVLMMTYNGEKYLVEQIESILNQRVSIDVDLIIRDDGSTDGTISILEAYAQAGKLRYSVGSNQGAAKGFIGLLRDNPGYDFYSFSDQDDVWNEDKLQKGIDAIKEYSGPALSCTNAKLVYSDLMPIGRNVHRCKPTYNTVSILCLASCAQGCTSVYNRKLAEIVQRHRMPDVFIMHDSLLTGLCTLIDGKIVYDHNPSMQYRMHGNNVLGMVSARQGVWRLVQSRLDEIMSKKKISMYSQAQSLLDTYGELINKDKRKICRLVVDSEKSMIARIKLILDRNLKHSTLNKTITKKLTILFGND